MALAGAGGIGGGGSGVVVPSPAPAWSDCRGDASVSTNNVTISGITVPISVQITNSGSASIYYNLNSSYMLYTGAFTVHPSDVLAWIVYNNAHPGTRQTGTVTVINVSNAGGAMASFAYSITNLI